MHIWTIATALATLLGLGAAPPVSAPATVKGELVTTMCFVNNGEKGRGEDHAACALKCATEGYPVAIVTKDGEMYKIVGKLTADKNVALREMLAKDVVATGEIGQEGEGKTLDAASVVLATPEMR